MGMSGPSLPDHVSSAKRLARLIGLVKQLRTHTLVILLMNEKNDKCGFSRTARGVGHPLYKGHWASQLHPKEGMAHYS